MSNQKELNFAEVAQLFHLPIKEAVKILGASRQVIKRCCLRNGMCVRVKNMPPLIPEGVPRWPFRKVAAVKRRIKQLSETPLGHLLHIKTETSPRLYTPSPVQPSHINPALTLAALPKTWIPSPTRTILKTPLPDGILLDLVHHFQKFSPDSLYQLPSVRC